MRLFYVNKQKCDRLNKKSLYLLFKEVDLEWETLDLKSNISTKVNQDT
jgi:hypothetical protein